MVFRLPSRLRDPFTALLLFGAAGILAMILAFAITSLPRLGAPSAGSGLQVQHATSPASTESPSPSAAGEKHGGGHKKGGGG